MEFIDCNCSIGRPALGADVSMADAGQLLTQMDRSGISKALVWHIAQKEHYPVDGNNLLAAEIAPHRERLIGCWSLLPPQTDELPPQSEFFRQMADAGVRALKAFPSPGRFLFRREVMGSLLEEISDRKIPLMIAPMGDISWDNIYDLLKDYPELTCVLCDVGRWGSDRFFRPLIEHYPNVHLEISEYWLDFGLEDFVKKYGARRILYGSGFPLYSHGGMMLNLRHSGISDSGKQAIAAGNFTRLMQEAKL